MEIRLFLAELDFKKAKETSSEKHRETYFRTRGIASVLTVTPLPCLPKFLSLQVYPIRYHKNLDNDVITLNEEPPRPKRALERMQRTLFAAALFLGSDTALGASASTETTTHCSAYSV